MADKQKLELTWIGKEHRPRLEPRILLEDPDRSYHAKHRVKMGAWAETQEGLTRRREAAKEEREGKNDQVAGALSMRSPAA
jgi:hypothetical protein